MRAQNETERVNWVFFRRNLLVRYLLGESTLTFPVEPTNDWTVVSAYINRLFSLLEIGASTLVPRASFARIGGLLMTTCPGTTNDDCLVYRHSVTLI